MDTEHYLFGLPGATCKEGEFEPHVKCIGGGLIVKVVLDTFFFAFSGNS